MKFIALSEEHRQFLIKSQRYSRLIFFSRIGLLVLLIALWEVITLVGLVDPFIASSPSRIVRTAVSMFGSGELGKHVWVSTYETLIGFALGTLLGFFIAILMWWSDFVKQTLEPYVVVLNSLPKIALGPLVIIWVGTGAASIIVMVLLVSVVITIITILNGFCQTNKEKELLLLTMGANKRQIFSKLVFPSNIPTIVSALKVNVGMAWVGTIMGEYLNSKAGLGYLIVYGGQVFKLDIVLTCTVILCALSAIMYWLVALLEKFVCKWQSK